MPEYKYNRVRHGSEDDNNDHIKVIKSAKSILEEDIFVTISIILFIYY